MPRVKAPLSLFGQMRAAEARRRAVIEAQKLAQKGYPVGFDIATSPEDLGGKLEDRLQQSFESIQGDPDERLRHNLWFDALQGPAGRERLERAFEMHPEWALGSRTMSKAEFHNPLSLDDPLYLETSAAINQGLPRMGTHIDLGRETIGPQAEHFRDWGRSSEPLIVGLNGNRDFPVLSDAEAYGDNRELLPKLLTEDLLTPEEQYRYAQSEAAFRAGDKSPRVASQIARHALLRNYGEPMAVYGNAVEPHGTMQFDPAHESAMWMGGIANPVNDRGVPVTHRTDLAEIVPNASGLVLDNSRLRHAFFSELDPANKGKIGYKLGLGGLGLASAALTDPDSAYASDENMFGNYVDKKQPKFLTEKQVKEKKKHDEDEEPKLPSEYMDRWLSERRDSPELPAYIGEEGGAGMDLVAAAKALPKSLHGLVSGTVGGAPMFAADIAGSLATVPGKMKDMDWNDGRMPLDHMAEAFEVPGNLAAGVAALGAAGAGVAKVGKAALRKGSQLLSEKLENLKPYLFEDAVDAKAP